MNFIRKLLKRKWVLALAGLILIGGGYFGYKTIKTKDAAPQYVTTSVKKGTLTVSVSGTGQVSSSNQIDIKPQVSGTVTKVAVQNGQEVKAGDLLVQLDSSEALKTVRDAQVSLDSAKLALEKLTKPADQLSLLQAENALAAAQEAQQKAKDDLAQSYEDAYNTISNAFLNMPTIIGQLENMFYSYDIGKSEATIGPNVWNAAALVNTTDANYRDSMQRTVNRAEADYKTARQKYDQNFIDYKNISRTSDKQTIEALLAETLNTTRTMSDAAKSFSNMFDTWTDYRSQKNLGSLTKITTYQSSLSTYIGQLNSSLSSLISQQTALQNDKDTLVSAQRTIREKTASLEDLKAGADPLDIKSQELAVRQRENALADAKEKLAYYTIRAPIDAVVASLNVKKADQASSGASLITLISKLQIAEISLNEVDVSKVKVGQKVILNFDAIDGLSLTGSATEIDSLGTASQGVVSYNVKITFDAQDERIKPSMSVSASIITDVRQDALLVPNSAVKSQGETTYVEILENGKPKSQTVQIGIANDSLTEIVSGAEEGQQVVTQTITANTTTKTNTQTRSQGIGIPGLGGGGPR